MEHTPGPWHVVKIPGESRPRVHAEVYDVADVCHAGGAVEANAMLIAAAPDMLAALREVMSSCCGDTMNEAARERKTHALYLAASAVAKAEGRDA